MKDFCLFVCSDNFELRSKALSFIIEIRYISEQLGISLTHLGYSFKATESSDNFYHEGPFNLENVEKLKLALEHNLISEINLQAVSEIENGYLNSELIVSEIYNDYKYLYIQFPLSRIVDMPLPTLFLFTSGMLSSLTSTLGQPDYAFFTMMDSKIPPAYFRGIMSPGVSYEEALNLIMWERKLSERKSKLRGLYWGNLLGKSHLLGFSISEFKGRLELLIGRDYVTMIDENLFFLLPSVDMASNNVSESVKVLLTEYGLLMEANDEDRKMASHLVSLE